MIKIETVKNGTATNIQFQGRRINVMNEMVNIAKHLSQQDDDFADALLMGISEVIPKDKIIEKLNRIEKSRGDANLLDLIIRLVCENETKSKAKQKKRKGEKINGRN